MMQIDDLKKQLLADKDAFLDIIGQHKTKHQLKSALLAGHNVIIVGAPGIGKTTLAKNLAKLLPDLEVNDCGFNCSPDNPICPSCRSNKKQKVKKISGDQRFVRIQGSPDLTAEDLIGDIDPIKAMKFGPLSFEAFTPGKIFKANNSVLFFDEVNRCPEKLQNALLQVLSEKHATIGSYDVDLPADLVFIATMNPEDSSTEPLSDVFLDRFDLIYMDYPESVDIEKRIVRTKGFAFDVKFQEELFHAMIAFVRLLRESKKLEKKPSVRASISLYERSQTNALLKKKKKVDEEDVQEAIKSVLAHRIKLIPSAKYLKTPEDFLEEEFKDFSKFLPRATEKSEEGP
ncbi:MAG: AAA family ATPase [Nanoarchaeota archaeon]|nr:AAA family ATPase [Nanoarchaeota archaeon]